MAGNRLGAVGHEPEGLGGGTTITDLDRVRRIARWRSLRIGSVLRIVVVSLMIGDALVSTDHSRLAQQVVLLGAYALIALGALIFMFSSASRSLTADTPVFVLGMVDVAAIFGFKLLSPGGYLALMMLVLAPRMVALDLSGRRAGVVLALTFAAFTVSIVQDPFITRRIGWPQTWLVVVVYGFICGTALMAVVFRLRHLHEMLRITASQEALLAETMTAAEAERREISEAIHDGPLQGVLAAQRDIVDFIKTCPAEPLQRAVASLDDVSRRLREATFELHPAVLDQVGLGAAVEKLATFTADRSGIAITTAIDYPGRNAIDPMVFGVVRELLSNVARHSQAKQASVILVVVNGTCLLDVLDDGVGITGEIAARRLADGHIGLASHRARVEAAGGSLKIVDTPAGTHIRAQWPLPE